MLYINNSLKDTNRKVNYDLRYVFEWLRANKISLNSGKTEFILSRSKHKNITKNMNFRINGPKIDIICKTKYLGEHLTFKYQQDILKLKINKLSSLNNKIFC